MRREKAGWVTCRNCADRLKLRVSARLTKSSSHLVSMADYCGPAGSPVFPPTLMLRPMTPAVPRRILPVIVLSQFAGTSLWFAVNAVLPDLQQAWALPPTALASLTSAVQLGFVAGTLVFALLMLADRFR